jgi:hypothetical protein
LSSLPGDDIYEDDDPQTAGWSKLSDGQDGYDGFAEDVDDDDLSFDGIYDDEPPGYREEPPAAAVDVDSLPRLLNSLRVSPANTSRSPRPQRYYPGIDVCIVGSRPSVHLLIVLSFGNRFAKKDLLTQRMAKAILPAV